MLIVYTSFFTNCPCFSSFEKENISEIKNGAWSTNLWITNQSFISAGAPLRLVRWYWWILSKIFEERKIIVNETYTSSIVTGTSSVWPPLLSSGTKESSLVGTKPAVLVVEEFWLFELLMGEGTFSGDNRCEGTLGSEEEDSDMLGGSVSDKSTEEFAIDSAGWEVTGEVDSRFELDNTVDSWGLHLTFSLESVSKVFEQAVSDPKELGPDSLSLTGGGEADAWRRNSAWSASVSPGAGWGIVIGEVAVGLVGSAEGDTTLFKKDLDATGRFGFCGIAGGAADAVTGVVLDIDEKWAGSELKRLPLEGTGFLLKCDVQFFCFSISSRELNFRSGFSGRKGKVSRVKGAGPPLLGEFWLAIPFSLPRFWSCWKCLMAEGDMREGTEEDFWVWVWEGGWWKPFCFSSTLPTSAV